MSWCLQIVKHTAFLLLVTRTNFGPSPLRAQMMSKIDSTVDYEATDPWMLEDVESQHVTVAQKSGTKRRAEEDVKTPEKKQKEGN